MVRYLMMAILVMLAGCMPAPEVVYLNEKGEPAEPSKAVFMKHAGDDGAKWIYEEIICIGGYQAYRLSGTHSGAFLWVPHPGYSAPPLCDRNTLADGSQYGQ